VKTTGGFIGNGAISLYLGGELGKPLFKGGHGKAESLYLESVKLINRLLLKKLKHAVEKFKPDLVIGYTPYPDETLHIWFGFADYERTGVDTELGEKMRFYLGQAFKYADEYLGEVIKLSSIYEASLSKCHSERSRSSFC